MDPAPAMVLVAVLAAAVTGCGGGASVAGSTGLPPGAPPPGAPPASTIELAGLGYEEQVKLRPAIIERSVQIVCERRGRNASVAQPCRARGATKPTFGRRRESIQSLSKFWPRRLERSAN